MLYPLFVIFTRSSKRGNTLLGFCHMVLKTFAKIYLLNILNNQYNIDECAFSVDYCILHFDYPTLN